VHAIVRDEMQKTGVPAERVVLGGFSQGGAIAVQATLAFPEKLAGGVVRLTLAPHTRCSVCNRTCAELTHTRGRGDDVQCFSGWLVDANGVGGRIDTANKEVRVCANCELRELHRTRVTCLLKCARVSDLAAHGAR